MEDKFEQIATLNRRMKAFRLCTIIIGAVMGIIMLVCAVFANTESVGTLSGAGDFLVWLIRLPFLVLSLISLSFYCNGISLREKDGEMDEENDCYGIVNYVMMNSLLILAFSVMGLILAEIVYKLF